MTITSMENFQVVCRKKFMEFCNTVNVYNYSGHEEINYEDTFVVWCSKTLQNYKCLVSTIYNPLYAEYTYNGDMRELYEDVYKKISNQCFE